MKRVHPAAQAGKRTTTIIAIILISALAVTGAAITHGLGMWGTKPATVATSASTKTKTSQPQAKQSSQSQEQTNKQATPSETESPSPEPALHVEAQSYEFDMPEYWRDRVTAHVDGDTVTLLSKAYPDMDHPICNIRVADGEKPIAMGDIGRSAIGWVPMTSAQHIEVWAYRYPRHRQAATFHRKQMRSMRISPTCSPEVRWTTPASRTDWYQPTCVTLKASSP